MKTKLFAGFVLIVTTVLVLFDVLYGQTASRERPQATKPVTPAP